MSMWRRLAGLVAGAMMAGGGVAWAGGVGGTGGWVVNGVTQGQSGGGSGSSGPVVAQSVIYVNGDYPNVQAAMDALFAAVPTNAVMTNATVAQAYGEYVVAGLRDNTGQGAVTLACFNRNAQLWHDTRGLPEAGASLVATLLDGRVKEHYRESRLEMTGISSLGWPQFDLFLYGFRAIPPSVYGSPPQVTNDTVRCWNASNAEVTPRTCGGFDPLNATHRTQFIEGVNYVKFPGLYGDNVRVEFPQGEFSGIQIVKSGAGAEPEAIGVRWTGGGRRLATTNAVGAEVACGGWYNIDPYGVIYR